MRRGILAFTIAALTLVFGVAWAQDQKSDKDRGGVLDVLQGVLRGERQLRGNVVAVHDSDIVVRGDDGRTYVVNTSGLDASTAQSLKPGQAVSVTARSAGQGGVLNAIGVAVDERRGQRRVPAGSRLRAVGGERIPGAQDRRRPDADRRYDRSERHRNRARRRRERDRQDGRPGSAPRRAHPEGSLTASARRPPATRMRANTRSPKPPAPASAVRTPHVSAVAPARKAPNGNTPPKISV